MFEERIALGHLTTHIAVLHNDFQIDQVLDRLGKEVQLRNANFIRNASPFVLDNVETAVGHFARYGPTQGDTFSPTSLVPRRQDVHRERKKRRQSVFWLHHSRVRNATQRGRNRPGD